MKINVEKTQAKYIGKLEKADYFPHGLSWIKTPLVTLGICITDNDTVNYQRNFQQRIMSLKNTLQIWKARKLSIKGKITILNNLALAPLIYVASVTNTPKRAIEEISDIVNKFLWDNSTAKISQKTQIQEIKNGGLKLCHFQTKVESLQLSWVKRLSEPLHLTWTIIPKYYYKTKHINLLFGAKNDLTPKLKIPTFYKNIHNIYITTTFLGSTDPQ